MRSATSAAHGLTYSPTPPHPTQGIYPLHDVYVRKVKVLRKPKFDIGKLLEVHGETAVTETGATVGRKEKFVEPTPLENV